MPIYRIRCEVCGKEDEIFRTISEMDDLPNCCEHMVTRIICAPMVASDIKPYRSMIDGSMITSRSKHRAHLKQHGCIEVGNETKHLKPPEKKPPQGLKQVIADVVYNRVPRG